jgi:hypothetical protein
MKSEKQEEDRITIGPPFDPTRNSVKNLPSSSALFRPPRETFPCL